MRATSIRPGNRSTVFRHSLEKTNLQHELDRLGRYALDLANEITRVKEWAEHETPDEHQAIALLVNLRSSLHWQEQRLRATADNLGDDAAIEKRISDLLPDDQPLQFGVPINGTDIGKGHPPSDDDHRGVSYE